MIFQILVILWDGWANDKFDVDEDKVLEMIKQGMIDLIASNIYSFV